MSVEAHFTFRKVLLLIVCWKQMEVSCGRALAAWRWLGVVNVGYRVTTARWGRPPVVVLG